MWENIVTATAVLGLVALMFRFIWSKIDKVGDELQKKQDKELCAILHQEVKMNAKKLDERFDKVENKLDDQNKTLSEVSTQMAVIANEMKRKNGA